MQSIFLKRVFLLVLLTLSTLATASHGQDADGVGFAEVLNSETALVEGIVTPTNEGAALYDVDYSNADGVVVDSSTILVNDSGDAIGLSALMAPEDSFLVAEIIEPTTGERIATMVVFKEKPEVFTNKFPDDLQDEKDAANDAGIEVVTLGEVIDDLDSYSETLKYVVLVDGTVLLAPKFHNGVEIITHAAICCGADVIAAGDCEVTHGTGQQPAILISIDNQSGHYCPSEESIDVARDIFGAGGAHSL